MLDTSAVATNGKAKHSHHTKNGAVSVATSPPCAPKAGAQGWGTHISSAEGKIATPARSIRRSTCRFERFAEKMVSCGITIKFSEHTANQAVTMGV